MKNDSMKKRKKHTGNESFKERRGIAFLTGRSSNSWERITAITICFTIVILLALLVPKILHIPKKSEAARKQSASVAAYEKSAEETSEAVGFKIKEPQAMPINLRTKSYEADGKTAVIYYKGLVNSITFKQAELTKAEKKAEKEGKDPAFKVKKPSGSDIRYTDSAIVESRTGYMVMLKSTGNGYITALWSDGEYSYSVTGDRPFSERQIMEAVNSVA